MNIQDKNLSIIHSVIDNILPECRLFLFGSRAKMTNASDSDYDVLIISPKHIEPKAKMSLKTSIRKELLKLDIRTDILIQSQIEVNEKKILPGHIIKSALNEGVAF